MNYDKPETWDESIHTTPLGVDVKAYQNKINGICGLNPFGKPNVLLTWMPSIENYSRYYTEWNEAGFGTKAVLKGMYVYDENLSETVPPPRWALKQFVHPDRYIAADEQSRWGIHQSGQQVFLRELRPPRSDKGFYARLLNIGRHNGYCCKKLKKQGSTCWGNYREPDESYLKLLRKAVRIREKEESQNPNEPLSERTLKQAALEAANEIKAKEKEQEDFLMSHFEEYLPEIVAQATGDQSFLDKKKEYSFSKAGLYLPKNYV